VYATPADDRPRMIEWEAGTDMDSVPVSISWWQPATIAYGGRDNATVVIDSKGEMSVFHGLSQVGAAPAPYPAQGPTWPEFWPLGMVADPAAWSHRIRDTGCMIAMVDNLYGLAMTEEFTEHIRWKLASAFTLLKFYPPLGLGFDGTEVEFEDGVQVLEERAARRVKRALLERLAAERRVLRGVSDRIEAHWGR